MTRRERMERRLEKRQEWAEGRARKAGSASDRAYTLMEGLTPGQPILVGHHSEKRHRAHLAKIDSAMRASVENGEMAAHHRAKASGIESQLESSIFSDDDDAIEQLQAKVESLEAERKRMRDINAAWRKAKKPKPDDAEGWQKIVDDPRTSGEDIAALRFAMARTNAMHYGEANLQPFQPYQLSNLGGRITQAKKRIESVKAQQARSQAAEEAGGVVISRSTEHNWATVTFAEKPERALINELKAAGYRWGGGSWSGYLDKLPEAVAELG